MTTDEKRKRIHDITYSTDSREELAERIVRLAAENAKLRRLVRTYRACHDHVDACRGCSELPDCEALEKMRSIGREVGIEVD